MNRRLLEAAGALKTNPDELTTRIGQVQDQVKSLEKELTALKSKMAAGQGDELATQAVDVNGIKVLAATLDGADVARLRETMDKLKDKLKTAAIVLASVADGKVSLIAGVTADATGRVKAGELVNFVAQQVGGKGGGRPDMAQAGGTNPSGLPLDRFAGQTPVFLLGGLTPTLLQFAFKLVDCSASTSIHACAGTSFPYLFYPSFTPKNRTAENRTAEVLGSDPLTEEPGSDPK
jgi:hypothetical protein